MTKEDSGSFKVDSELIHIDPEDADLLKHFRTPKFIEFY